MLDERSEHEPEEYDPEADLYDSESDSMTIPQVEIPEVSTSETDAPPELVRQFWVLVLVLNAALFAVSLGAMLLYFRSDVFRGGGLLVGAVVLLGFAAVRYRSARDLAGETDPADSAERTSSPRDERTSPDDTDPDADK